MSENVERIVEQEDPGLRCRNQPYLFLFTSNEQRVTKWTLQPIHKGQNQTDQRLPGAVEASFY